MKSSMDPELLQHGRPHGGVGFICKPISGVSYIPIQSDYDRVYGLKLVSDGKTLLTIVGVYMPYHDGRRSNFINYSETLEDAQCIMDSADSSPIIFVGDMNVSLPQCQQVTRNWFKHHPYTKHSRLMYDFVCENDLYSCNFRFDQPVNFTHFKGTNCSYIGHVFVTEYFLENVTECRILDNMDTNTSDHLPIRTTVRLNLCDSNSTYRDVADTIAKYPKVNWANRDICQQYALHIEERSQRL